MITVTLGIAEGEALVGRHLGTTPRAEHSRFVGALMGELARRLGADRGLWTAVGLVHDLDYFAVKGDWSRHGRVTAEWLADRLPPAALAAIAAHDHRSGVLSDTQLGDVLKLADALAVLDQAAGRMAMISGVGFDHWGDLAGERGFLANMIEDNAGRHGLDHAGLAAMLSGMLLQRPAGT